MNNPKLSVIILNHNTKSLLSDCLESIQKYRDEVPMEVIVSDNGSTDGTPDMVRKNFPWVKIIEGPNISFSNGNNRARKIVKGDYILFLNSDTLVHKNSFDKTINYIEKHKDVGALTCKILLKDGQLDKDARRRFPTPWISFNRLFLYNGKKYWYEDMPSDKTHEVDAIQGAFFLSSKKVLDQVGWFDEAYLFDGEDLDLCFQIKKAGYKIVYYPDASITHLKKGTKQKIRDIKLNRKMQGINSMEYFYKKNLWNNYSLFFSYFVILGIKIIKIIRFIKVKLFSINII